MPKIQPELAQRVDLDVLSNFVLRLSQAGMPLFPDEELESYIRDAGGMPDVADERALQVAGMSDELKGFFDENGVPKGMTQQPWTGPLIDIPIEKVPDLGEPLGPSAAGRSVRVERIGVVLPDEALHRPVHPPGEGVQAFVVELGAHDAALSANALSKSLTQTSSSVRCSSLSLSSCATWAGATFFMTDMA